MNSYLIEYYLSTKEGEISGSVEVFADSLDEADCRLQEIVDEANHGE